MTLCLLLVRQEVFGSALIQLVKRRGATVIALASEAKHECCLKSIGADVVLSREPENLQEELMNFNREKSSIGSC